MIPCSGKGVAQGRDDEPLRLLVDRRHEVDLRLEGDLLSPAVTLAEQRARAGSGGGRDALELVHRGLVACGPGPCKRG